MFSSDYDMLCPEDVDFPSTWERRITDEAENLPEVLDPKVKKYFEWLEQQRMQKITQ